MASELKSAKWSGKGFLLSFPVYVLSRCGQNTKQLGEANTSELKVLYLVTRLFGQWFTSYIKYRVRKLF